MTPSEPVLLPRPNPRGDIGPPTAREFQKIAGLVRQCCGLELSGDNRAMMWSRLIKIARNLECRSFSEYYRKVVADSSGRALGQLVDALTTHFTSFMREPAHFDFLARAVAPELATQAVASVWSAGTATGEEAYSIVICLLEALGVEFGARLRVLATDISSRALEVASEGVYAAAKVKDIDPVLLQKYFLAGSGRMAGFYRVKPGLRQGMAFRQMNLLDPPVDAGKHSIVFCRNVMIYFNRETQRAVVQSLAERLLPGGYLFIGHSETLSGCECDLEYVRPAIYRRRR